MKYFKKISLAGALFAFILAFTFSTSHAQDTTEVPLPDTYTVKGKVVDAQTTEVLADAKISIVGKDVSTVSDTEGKFILENLSAGAQTLKVELDGYEPWQKEINLEADTELEVKLEPTPEQ